MTSFKFLFSLLRRGRADSTLRKSTLCGDSCGRGQKTEDVLRFQFCASDPLWSRSKNCGLFTISDLCERPSAEIRVVEVKKLRTFYDCTESSWESWH